MEPFIDSTRALLKLDGVSIHTFMQGIVSANLKDLSQKKILYSLMLAPKGRFLYDFFIIKYKNFLLLDCDKFQINAIINHIKKFDVRNQAMIHKLSDNFQVCLHLQDNKITENAITYQDPRTQALGFRSIIKIPSELPKMDRNEDYEYIRILNCVPDSQKDMKHNESFPIECGLDALGCISFNKGCYIGQEVSVLMARKQKKRKLHTVISSSKNTLENCNLLNSDKNIIGIITSTSKDIGLCWMNKEPHSELYTENGQQVTLLN